MNVIGRGANQFHQKKANEAKLGAYYTDPVHCTWLSSLFSFSTEEETSVLEPSVGDGTAVKLVTDAENNPKIRIFADEINKAVAEELEKDPCFEVVLAADFKSEVFISNNVFSFCFGNPPYMEEMDFDGYRRFGGYSAKERVEKVFLEKVTNYLKPGGIICWVIPHRVLIEDSYCSFWMSRYETLGIYKFHEKEFAKWGQVAVVGRKRSCSVGVVKEHRIAFQERIALDNLDLVPTDVPENERISVPTSPANKVLNFRTIAFDTDAADKWVKEHPECISSLNDVISARTGVKKYGSDSVYAPPKKLSPQNLALLTACGVGSGYAGTVEEGNLHLQRGSVTIKVEEEVQQESGKSAILSVKKRSITNIVLIESDGTITDLVKTDGEEKEGVE